MSARCYVIAEAGLNHNGSVQLAKQLIDVAAAAGADAFKLQKRDVSTLATHDVLDALDGRFPSLGKTYREIRETLEFDRDEYKELKAYTLSKKLDFLCTAFDAPSLEFLEKLGVSAYKLASHSVTNVRLIEKVAAIGRPTFMSTGMCTLDELDRSVNIFKAKKTPLTLLHCVSAYPTQVEESNLRLMDTLRERYAVPVGFSGHELGWFVTLAAVARGAVCVERHYTPSNDLEGFDHKMSLNPADFTAMVADIRKLESALGNGEKAVTEREWITRRKYHVSMVSSCRIPAGTVLTDDKVVYRNPGTGIPYKEASAVLGKKALKDIPEDTLLEEGMFQ